MQRTVSSNLLHLLELTAHLPSVQENYEGLLSFSVLFSSLGIEYNSGLVFLLAIKNVHVLTPFGI